jgi:hypothetical protein
MTRFLIVLLMVVAMGGCSRPEPPLVLLLAGQSNMEGYGRTADLDAEDAVWPANVLYFEDGVAADPLGGNNFGPEISMAQVLSEALPGREIRLVKVAVGGTSMLAWAPSWDSTSAAITGNAGAGPMYAHLMAAVDSVTAGEEVEIGAAFWMQGERDARFADVGPGYGERIAGLVAALRADLGLAEMPFILGIVNPPADRYPALDEVRSAQRALAGEDAAVWLVDTDDISKWDDNLHYDSVGQLELGRRFARAFLEVSR